MPSSSVVATVLATVVATVSGAHCVPFCAAVEAACGVGNVYADTTTCEAECKNYARTILDGSFFGDTYECRKYHLSVAEMSQELATAHCPHTAADGGGVCVAAAQCTNFCKTFRDVTCPLDKDVVEYATQEKCEKTCKAYPQTDMFGAISGDTYQCREYHLSVARAQQIAADTAGEALHCGHARQFPSRGTCVPKQTRCMAFCATFTMYCSSLDILAVDKYGESCVADCDAMNMGGKLGDTGGDTLQCREYHLGVAALARGNPELVKTHCPHAGPTGGEVCVKGPTTSGAHSFQAFGPGAAFAVVTGVAALQ